MVRGGNEAVFWDILKKAAANKLILIVAGTIVRALNAVSAAIRRGRALAMEFALFLERGV